MAVLRITGDEVIAPRNRLIIKNANRTGGVDKAGDLPTTVTHSNGAPDSLHRLLGARPFGNGFKLPLRAVVLLYLGLGQQDRGGGLSAGGKRQGGELRRSVNATGRQGQSDPGAQMLPHPLAWGVHPWVTLTGPLLN